MANQVEKLEGNKKKKKKSELLFQFKWFFR